ncbi:MAG: 4Fe-4S dicluster domain-containing protein [Deltaproteobacteria bacterium]|nr:4Fe-4S dicluster domain-containing protein [Deltaproteobacteria bacterium]
MNKMLFADPDKCTGCNRCTYVCSAVKTGQFAPSRAHIQINNFPHKGFAAPSICFQCPGAPCHKACPANAISRNADDVVVVDAEKCTACGNCVTACPYGMIEQNEQKVAYKCDCCDGDPACVKECFSGALVFQEKTPALVKIKGLQMKQRATEGLPAEKRHQLGKALLLLSRD